MSIKIQMKGLIFSNEVIQPFVTVYTKEMNISTYFTQLRNTYYIVLAAAMII